MRNVPLSFAVLLVAFSVQAEAQTSDPNWPWALCMARARQAQDCMHLYVKRETPKTNTYRDNPDYKAYEFQVWQSEQDAAREVEAINRDYNLRRSGVLP